MEIEVPSDNLAGRIAVIKDLFITTQAPVQIPHNERGASPVTTQPRTLPAAARTGRSRWATVIRRAGEVFEKLFSRRLPEPFSWLAV